MENFITGLCTSFVFKVLTFVFYFICTEMLIILPLLFSDEGADAMRVFCGRRRTDLTPTIPIKREVYDMSASMMSTRSTTSSRGGGSGRVFYSSVSMTRLDRSRSPGCGNLAISAQHQHQGQRPSRSKSTTHLASTGLKMTRTEILRQALAQKKDKDGGKTKAHKKITAFYDKFVATRKNSS